MSKKQNMEKILLGLYRVGGYENGASIKAKSLIDWYNAHGELTKKQIDFARTLISRKPPAKLEKRKAYFLYAIDDGTNVKLGFSSSPQSRLRSLQTGAAKKLRIDWRLKVGDTRLEAVKAEKKLHRYCKKYRKRGEWFDRECMFLVKQFSIKQKMVEKYANEDAEMEIVSAANERI